MLRNTFALLLIALLILAAALAGATEQKVFQATANSTRFGYDVRSGSVQAWDGNPCEAATNDCMRIITTEDDKAFFGKGLTGDKSVYRVGVRVYASSEGATTGIHVAFSFDARTPTSAIQGDGASKGVFAESVQLRLTEHDDSWNLRLGQVHNGAYTELAQHSDLRSPNAWREYAFQADTKTGALTILDSSGTVILLATATHNLGGVLHSQWFMFKGYQSTFSNYAYLKFGGESTAIYDMDPRPPTITDLKQNPSEVNAGQTVQVTATIRDDWSQPTAFAKSWINGVQQANRAMTFQGTAAQVTLPGQDKAVVVRYQVVATDSSALSSQSDVIEYKVGSGKPPTSLGGGSASLDLDDSNKAAFLSTALGVLFVLGLGFLGFFVSRERYPRLAPKFVWAAIGVALAYVIFAVNRPTFMEPLQRYPEAFLLVVAAVVVVGAVVVHRRGNPT